jgi:uncharacterized protein
MSIIDAHVHLYPPEANRNPVAWAAAMGEAHWTTMCVRRRKNGRAVQDFPSVDDLLHEMDAAGVTRSVLLGWYWENPETCTAQNRFYAECVRAHPDRLSAFATLNARAGREATLAEVRRAQSEGLVGLGELSPHSQGFGVDDKIFHEVLALARELKLPVNLHVTDPKSRPYPGRVETPLEDFTRLARDFPLVNFILAHWGGMLPLGDAAGVGLANLYYDTAASPLLYDASVWKRFFAAVPSPRVLFGSDYPLNLYPMTDAAPAMAHFITEARQEGAPGNVMHGNAAALLRL